MCAALTAGGCRLLLRRQSRAVKSRTSDLCRGGGMKCVKKCQTKGWKQVLSHAGRFVHKCAGWPVTWLLFRCSDSAWNGADEDGSIKIWAHGWTTDGDVQGRYPPPSCLTLVSSSSTALSGSSSVLHIEEHCIDPPLSRLLSSCSSSRRLI